MQDYSALYEYMTADDWEHLRQDGAPFLRNCERVFERAYQLGLRRPTEPTLATMAVIAQGGGATSGFEANQIYLSAKARWRQWFRRREQARIEWEDYPVRLGSEECDRDPCVTAVLTAQPRVACPLDTRSMLSQVAMVPLRSTHATLAPARTVVSPAPPAPYAQLMGMAMQAMAHLQGQGAQGQGQQRAQDANEIPIVYNRRPSSASAGAGPGHRTDSSEQPALPGSAAGQGSQQLAADLTQTSDQNAGGAMYAFCTRFVRGRPRFYSSCSAAIRTKRWGDVRGCTRDVRGMSCFFLGDFEVLRFRAPLQLLALCFIFALPF